MTNREIAFEIYERFRARGTTWSIDGEPTKPSFDDIERVLDRLASAVYDGEEGTEGQTGGIIVRNQYGHLDVYLHIGEYKHDTN